MSKSINEYTLITGVVGEDVHVTGIRIMEHALRTEGFQVHSLGIHNTVEAFVEAAVMHQADAIMVSSLCGHASILVDIMRQACVEAQIGDIHLCLGGQLVIHEEPWEETRERFEKMGFDRVYPPFIMPTEAISLLKEDLHIVEPTKQDEEARR
jgi:methylaspartate mutase sigma subunit